MKTKSLFSFFGACILFVALQSAGCQKDETTPVPSSVIGTTGPAGGVVFYDKGYYSEGWRYMEIAPETNPLYSRWNLLGVSVPTYYAVGKGEYNTNNMVNAGISSAAQYCYDYSLNGYNDWFLPSGGEIDLVYANLNANQANLAPEGYWSSTQYDADFAFTKNPSLTTCIETYKEDLQFVRPIRSY